LPEEYQPAFKKKITYFNHANPIRARVVFCYLGPTVSKTIENDITMETIKTELYEAPTTDVIVVKAEGAILVVSGDAPQYEGPEEF
jgi:hypothetical protein